MKQAERNDIAAINAGREEDRKCQLELKDSDWHFLVYKGVHTPLHMRCPDRQHVVYLSPAQALSEGCPICAKMDAPPTTVTVARLKADVEKQDKSQLKSLNKSRRRMQRGGYGLDQYWMGK